MPDRISYAQNGEDVRIWHAFGPRQGVSRDPNDDLGLVYVEIGANEPRHLSPTAALYDLGWRGLLVEADPLLANRLREERPDDVVVEVAAAAAEGHVTFFRVPGTGLGTLDPSEAAEARNRGFEVIDTQVTTLSANEILRDFLEKSGIRDIHAMIIDVEGAEKQVLAGLNLTRYRPWVICIEAVEPGSSIPSHQVWEHHLRDANYREVAFDGVNRWYLAQERADLPVSNSAGAPPGSSIADAISTPMNILDEGVHGWTIESVAIMRDRDNHAYKRPDWQRELILRDLEEHVSVAEYERQINELRAALIEVEGSRSWAVSRSISRVGKKCMHIAQQIRSKLPRFVNEKIIRERHLRHVIANMRAITDDAYLGESLEDHVTWIADQNPESIHYKIRPPIPPGLDLHNFRDIGPVADWLEKNVFDSDEQLNARMDNHDDEVGRVRAALRTRLRLATAPTRPHQAEGGQIAVDARALQSPAFGNRGIGRFARAVLLAAREVAGDHRITLIVDSGLRPLPHELAGECKQVTRITKDEVAQFGLLIEPSPMTQSVEPVIALLHSQVHTIAVVFDFIPLHYPSIYLRDAASRAEYAASLDALKLYKEYVCISDVTRRELAVILGLPASGPEAPNAVVAWPRDITMDKRGPRANTSIGSAGPIVLMSGDEPRKNTFGGLAGIGAATANEIQRDVVVVGMAGQDTRVHHWSIAAAIRPGEVQNLEQISDAELHELIVGASCVVVPSFDEGLSLPVIEAVRAGVPVVASSIASHQELVGKGAFTCNPRSPRSIARAIERTRGRQRVAQRQSRKLERHSHAILEDVVADAILDNVQSADVLQPLESTSDRPSSSKLSVGVATPWNPQRTGVADFSAAVFTELASLVDLTVYTTAGASVTTNRSSNLRIEQRQVEEVFADPMGVSQRHDAFISVVGNSFYHLPFVELLSHIEAHVVAHDTRMVEYFMALRGTGGVEQLMLTTADSAAPMRISPSLDDQVSDMRLLQNAGFWEVANRAQSLIVHSPSAASTLSQQTAVPVHVLPFANQRVPVSPRVTDTDRSDARARLGLTNFPSGTVHLGSFGFVDPRTKMTDVVLESAAWLSTWGHSVALHLIGSATEDVASELEVQASRSGLDHFQITGFQTEEQFRDWLLAVDIGIQLRVSPLLGVSGPLSDLAAFGTPAVASHGLCVDVDTPAYINRLPDALSPVLVAEAIENVLSDEVAMSDREQMRRDYLLAKEPAHYARLLLEMITVS